jgi:hypothetical protein
MVQQYVTASTVDARAERDSLKFAAAPATSVALVTVEKSCASARDAYNAARQSTEPAATAVYLIVSGSGSSVRYVVRGVRAPGSAASEFASVLLLDSKFRILSAFTS